MIGALAGCALEEPDTADITQASINFSSTMSNLSPVGWWRLGETTGSAADSSGNGHAGSFLNFSSGRGVAGAIAGDSNGAVQITPVTNSCSSSPFVEIADHDDFSLTKAQDSFDRADSGSYWGAADHGGTWTAQVSTTESYYSISSNHAVISETTTGTWQMGLPITNRKDVDVQVKVSWNQHAAGATMMPLAVVARRTDDSNTYRAELRETTANQLELRIYKVVAGTFTQIGSTASLGAYTVNDWWYVRFQVEGTNLRARAWKTTQPTTWQVSGTDSELTAAGGVSLRSSNSGTTVNPTVSFDDFRVQSVGMTVHAFMKPTDTGFVANNDYVHILGKGVDPNMEWAFRYYSSSDTSFPNRVSGYIWKPTKLSGESTNLGAGASFDSANTNNTWYEIVTVYDPGDKLDQDAGVTMYENGACSDGVHCGDTGIWLKYSNTQYNVTPLNGTSPLRIGTRDCSSGFFTGALDEVAVFDRKLTATEIANLHTASQ